MGLMAVARRRPWLVWPGAILAAFLVMVGTFLLVHEREGQIAVDFLKAVAAGDLEKAGGLALVDGRKDALADAIPPSFAWIPEKIVETSPNDSAYAYDAVVRTHSADLTLSTMTDLDFAVAVDGGTEYVLDPLGRALVDPGAELGSMTIAGRPVDAAARSFVLLPGTYVVEAVAVDGTRLTGRITVTGPTADPPTARLRPAG